MNFNNAASLLVLNAYSVQLKFLKDNGTINGNKVYDYLCDIPGVVVGQDVVVMAPNFETGEGVIPKLCRIVSVDDEITVDLMADFEYKWVVQVIDYTSYNDKKDAAAELNKKLTQAKRRKMREQLVNTILNELGLDWNAITNQGQQSESK